MPSGKDKQKNLPSQEQLVVEAELLDTGMEAPGPGIMYIISLMRYKVLKVVQGVYPYQFILVGHHVPDLNSPEFHIGVRHLLHLSKDFPDHANILNKFQDESDQEGVFFCVSFEVLE